MYTTLLVHLWDHIALLFLTLLASMRTDNIFDWIEQEMYIYVYFWLNRNSKQSCASLKSGVKWLKLRLSSLTFIIFFLRPHKNLGGLFISKK